MGVAPFVTTSFLIMYLPALSRGGNFIKRMEEKEKKRRAMSQGESARAEAKEGASVVKDMEVMSSYMAMALAIARLNTLWTSREVGHVGCIRRSSLLNKTTEVKIEMAMNVDALGFYVSKWMFTLVSIN